VHKRVRERAQRESKTVARWQACCSERELDHNTLMSFFRVSGLTNLLGSVNVVCLRRKTPEVDDISQTASERNSIGPSLNSPHQLIKGNRQ